MAEDIKYQVYRASQELYKQGLVIFKWGNVSAIDPSSGNIVIKPSGIAYDEMIPADMVIVDREGKKVEGSFEATHDLETHLELYRNFPEVGAIVHSHSEWATTWAQAGLGIPAYGISHANYFNGEVPCTRQLTVEEINDNLERHTGRLIVDTFKEKKLDPIRIPAVLVNAHGPFVWGKTIQEALDHAYVLEQVAKLAYNTRMLRDIEPIKNGLVDRYYKYRQEEKLFSNS